MPRKKIPYKIPYIKSQDPKWRQPIGSIPYQITRYEMRNPKWAEKYEWKDNEPFDACIKFVRICWSGKTLWKCTATDAEYYIGQTALANILKTKSIVYGTVIARWRVRKHGDTYSLVLVTS